VIVAIELIVHPVKKALRKRGFLCVSGMFITL
jgi:hypothetical protein